MREEGKEGTRESESDRESLGLYFGDIERVHVVKMIIFETSKGMMNITTNFCRKEREREREGDRERERKSGIWIDIFIVFLSCLSERLCGHSFSNCFLSDILF